MKNYYQTLGVETTASAEEIKRAYRKLASQHHPDKGGDKGQFQQIQEAYNTLGDPQKRAEYDNPGFRMHGGAGGQPFNFESIFDIFGTRFQHVHPQRTQARMTLWIQLVDVAQGNRRTISLGTQQGVQAVEIDIPVGINDGDTVQYSGMAPGGGDLIVTFRIHPNPLWQRQESNLITEHTILVWDCILGCSTLIRDIQGNHLDLTIPPRIQPGTVLRLRGRGLPRRNGPPGDLLVKIQVSIPEHISSELLAEIEKNK
jgi:DnaJ-class molecular chaperone